jgi:archaellum biogenesis ATPase FlaH
MDEMFFLKEVALFDKNLVRLILLRQNQLKKAIDFFLQRILNEEDKEVILVSFLQNNSEIFEKHKSKKLHVVDCSEKGSQASNTILLKNINNLTKIQIAIEKFIENLEGNKIIIFDSLSVLSIYHSEKNLGRFIYFFTNKTKIEENSCIYLATKDAIGEEVINLAKQFCDQTYDFSEVNVGIGEKY